MAEQPPGEKTEQPTEKRLKDVRKKGQLQRSQDMSAWLVVGAAAAMFPTLVANTYAAVTDQLLLIEGVMANPTKESALRVAGEGFSRLPALMLPVLIVTFVACVVAARAMGPITMREMKPKADHLQPMNGLKKVFGLMAAWNGVKALLKSSAIALVMWFVIETTISALVSAGILPVDAVLARAWDATTQLIQLAVAAGMALAIADIAVVWKKNRKATMMTKQEVKDEFKQSDGDPQAKAHRKALQHQLTRNGMLSAMKDADAVIVNPIHVAVAVRYDPSGGITVPIVVAKGRGHVATRLREEADTLRIPMIQNIMLARSLEKDVPIGGAVPEQFFAEVAQVLAFVERLRTRGATRGIHRLGALQSSAPSKENRAHK